MRANICTYLKKWVRYFERKPHLWASVTRTAKNMDRQFDNVNINLKWASGILPNLFYCNIPKAHLQTIWKVETFKIFYQQIFNDIINVN